MQHRLAASLLVLATGCSGEIIGGGPGGSPTDAGASQPEAGGSQPDGGSPKQDAAGDTGTPDAEASTPATYPCMLDLGFPLRFGVNARHPNEAWTDATAAELYARVGAGSLRIALPEAHLAKWGYDVEVPDMQAYAALGLHEHTAILSTPIREHSTAPPTAKDWELAHYIPKNLYEPVTLPDGTVNPDNYWADYVYRTVSTYKQWVTVWEVWNEPDDASEWKAPDAWYNVPPDASVSPRFRGSVIDYVRMLRVSTVAAKLADPDAKVATGGLLTGSFLYAILSYTDNPADGSATPAFPETAGAYFDVLSFHRYVIEHPGTSDGSPGTSEDALSGLMSSFPSQGEIITNLGFQDKEFAVTAIGAPHVDLPNVPSGSAFARNYLMKAITRFLQSCAYRFDWHAVSDYAEPDGAGDPYGWMGLFEDVSTLESPDQAVLTPTGVAYATMSMLLDGARSDPDTAYTIGLTSLDQGGAFALPSGATAYVLWAYVLSADEQASRTFNLPVTGPHRVYAWDYSQTGESQLLTPFTGGISLSLTGTPLIVVEELE